MYQLECSGIYQQTGDGFRLVAPNIQTQREYGGDKSLKYSSTDCCKPGRGIEINIFWRTLNTIFQLCDIFFWSDFRVLRMICHQTSVVYSINKYFHYKIFIIVHKFINITKDW